MPRFTEHEKDAIRKKLFKKGEQLFVQHGIKKVTIEDLTKAVGIASGSFYSFFDSKESLYLEININMQNSIFSLLQDEIANKKHMTSKELAKYIIKCIIEKFCVDPIFTMLDMETWNHISRKVSSDLLKRHLEQDVQMIAFISQLGVEFRYSPEQTVKSIELLLLIARDTTNSSDYADAFSILVDGTISRLILD